LAKFARLLNPSRFSDLDPNLNNIKEQFSPILNFISTADFNSLQVEYPIYKALAQDVVINNEPNLLSAFWFRHSEQLPTWFKLYKHLSLCQPSSGSVERAIATFNSVSIGKECALEETMETEVLLRYNHSHW